mmetsp:Transcript_16493/g.35687  ORF Transcript_16493/g.35687 Transcript_16493/m.35687 type:complete len:218 (+) Transcript_16493:369-1022(+)
MGDDDDTPKVDDVALARRGCRRTGVMESAVAVAASSFLPRRDGSGAPHRVVGRTVPPPRGDGSRRWGVSTTMEPASEPMPAASRGWWWSSSSSLALMKDRWRGCLGVGVSSTMGRSGVSSTWNSGADALRKEEEAAGDRGSLRGVPLGGVDASNLVLAVVGLRLDWFAGAERFSGSDFDLRSAGSFLLFSAGGTNLGLGGAFTSRNNEVMLDNFELK